MATLSFPEPTNFTREQSYGDHSTSFSSGGGIPIDPALSAPPVDPALLAEGWRPANSENIHPPAQFAPFSVPSSRQYSQGPQGDPFAPQLAPVYIPFEQPASPPNHSRSHKKRRPPRRQEECGVCQGSDLMNNKTGHQEQMVSCAECGRSAHPTCLQLPELGHIMLSYDWNCADCKKCEVCKQKSRPHRMIFCDFCDRGWHMDCLDPPIDNAPPGKWHCPLCPPLPSQDLDALVMDQSQHLEHPPDPGPTDIPPVLPSTGDVAETDGDASTVAESDLDIGGETTPRASTRKGKKRSHQKSKAAVREVQQSQEILSSTLTLKRKRLRLTPPSPPPLRSLPTVRLRLPPRPPRSKGKGREEDPEEVKRGLFDDILTPEDRDTTLTSITEKERERFEKSRLAAEEKLQPPSAIPDVPDTPGAGPSSRPLRSVAHYHSTPISAPMLETSQSPVPSTPGGLPKVAPGQRIQRIRFGEYDIEAWYDAPFPEEYAHIPDGRLWICEFCLKYMKSSFAAYRHKMKCKIRHPPGDEIYRDGAISIFEVDGRKNKIYCQNLCLLSKMFLDHKSLFYDVEPFLFYVMTELDESGCRFVGYFSKEKRSPKDYNVSCIMTLPVRQRQGWGNLLIDFSYLLSKKEQRTGSPEKPLSALGALGYRNYWTLSVMRFLQRAPFDIRLEDISRATAMTLEDLHSTLVHLNMITVHDSAAPPKPLPGQSIKFPKGRKNGIARKHLQRTQTQDDEKVKGPFVPPVDYEIHWDPREVEEFLARWEAKGYFKLRSEKLKWSPFISARTPKSEQLMPETVEDTNDSRSQSNAAPGGEQSSTPGPRSTSEVQTPALPGPTPVSALFDDDNVEITDKADPGFPEPSVAQSSASGSSWDADQLEQDRILAERLATMPERRLRSRGLSTDTSSVNGTFLDSRPLLPERRKSSRQTTSPVIQRNSSRAKVDDTALTTRSSVSEDRKRRHLRSRSNGSEGIRRNVGSPASPRSVSPRKRRRIDSSPETEPADVPPSSPVRRSLRHTAENHDHSANGTVDSLQQPRRITRSTNGSKPSSSLQNPQSIMAPPALNGQTNSSDSRRDVEEQLQDASEHGDLENDIVHSPVDEMKYEDTDTPATLMNSRHSAPSDDTVFGEGDEVAAPYKEPAEVAAPYKEPAEVAQEQQHPPVAPIIAASTAYDELGEEDAEGEDDIDAEGEPDDDDERLVLASVSMNAIDGSAQDGQILAV